MLKIILFLTTILMTCICAAESSVGTALTIDQSISESMPLRFEDDDKLMPKIGEFKILSSLLMSNEVGERWATITLENMSTQQRLLDSEHIVAVFANGYKCNPMNVEQKFRGREVITITMSFGANKFPILKVLTRH